MATPLTRRIGLCAVLLTLLAACGVRVEISERPTLAPTPRPRLVRYADVTRVVASPRLIFRDSKSADALPFMHNALNNALVIKNRTLVINADYEGTWLKTMLGTGRMYLALYSRREENGTWVLVGNDSEDNIQTYALPGRNSGVLTIYYQPDTIGFQHLRAEIEISARAADSLPNPTSGAAELSIQVFSPPDNIETNPEIIRPALGNPDPQHFLIDWRSWNGEICTLADNVPTIPTLKTACGQVGAKNYKGAIETLSKVQSKDETLMARLQDQMGYLSVAANDLPTANAAFRQAAEYWLKTDKILAYSISAQNEVATRLADEGTLPQLERLLELAYQMEENPGRAIAEANYYYMAQDRYGLQDLTRYFAERSLPQSAIIEKWLEKIPEKH